MKNVEYMVIIHGLKLFFPDKIINFRDTAFTDTIVNLTCQSINGGLLEITDITWGKKGGGIWTGLSINISPCV